MLGWLLSPCSGKVSRFLAPEEPKIDPIEPNEHKVDITVYDSEGYFTFCDKCHDGEFELAYISTISEPVYKCVCGNHYKYIWSDQYVYRTRERVERDLQRIERKAEYDAMMEKEGRLENIKNTVIKRLKNRPRHYRKQIKIRPKLNNK